MSSRNRRRGGDEPTGLGHNTKEMQLCGQVQEAVAYALLCSTNPILRELVALGVEPMRGTAAMRIVIQHGDDDDDDVAIREALDRAMGYIRAEVARTINRKRMPTLEFALLPTSARAESGSQDSRPPPSEAAKPEPG